MSPTKSLFDVGSTGFLSSLLSKSASVLGFTLDVKFRMLDAGVERFDLSKLSHACKTRGGNPVAAYVCTDERVM
ncbi:hypothetical protein Tco_0190201 [Tanacetum coccineum]